MSHFEQILTSLQARSSTGSGETRELIVPAVPVARCPITVRPAVAGDAGFIDQLQKMHAHMVGWMPGKQIEGKIALGHVLVAEEATERRSDEATEGIANAGAPSLTSVAPSLRRSPPSPLGYCISHDQYMGRDDVGVIFQLIGMARQ